MECHIARRNQRLVKLYFTLFLYVLGSKWNFAHAESIELRITEIAGLVKHSSGQEEYAMYIYECSPLCSIMGLELLSETNSVHVISNEGISGRFRLSISLKKRTRPPPQQRLNIPVEVVGRESHLSDVSVAPRGPSDSSYSQQPLSNFEPYGRVLVTGATPGEKGNLNHNWRYTADTVAEFIVDTTISAIRRCRKSCRFKSDAPFVKRFVRNGTLEKPSFRLQLAAFRDSSPLEATPRELLFAGYFAEAAEKGSAEDLIPPFPFPERGDSESSSPLASKDLTGECSRYRFLAAIGEEVAYVWRLSLVNDRSELDERDHLDTGRNEKGTIVVAFKDIPRSSSVYQHIWGRDELLPLAFTGSVPFDHFRSFGKVHKGLLNRYNQVADELRTWLRPGANVVITGSFAGGAMAALAFADWLSDSTMGLGMTYGVTFGAAQVGDKLFQKAFRELGRYEPSRASYGYFEQLAAADERTGKVDISTRFPSTIFENFVSYPGVHSLDCLRAVLPVEKIVQSSPGHLRTFRPIGRRRFLYFGSHLRPAPSRLPFPRLPAPRLSRDGLNAFAGTFFILQTNRMAHYMERLTSLYADSQQALQQSNRGDAPRFSKLRVRTDLRKHSASPSTCHGTVIPNPSKKLTLSISLSSNPPMSESLGLGINLCSSCSPHMGFNETLCHPIPHISNNSNPDYAKVPSSSSPPSNPLVFSTLRPIEAHTCMQLVLYWLQKPHTCATDTLPREMVHITSAPLLEMTEVVSCTGQERCGLDFEGMRVTIVSREEALVGIKGEEEEGEEERKLGVFRRGQAEVGTREVAWMRGEEMRRPGTKEQARGGRVSEVLMQRDIESRRERTVTGGLRDIERGTGDTSEGLRHGAAEVATQRENESPRERKVTRGLRDSERGTVDASEGLSHGAAEVATQRDNESRRERKITGGLRDSEGGSGGANEGARHGASEEVTQRDGESRKERKVTAEVRDSERGTGDANEVLSQIEREGWETGGAMAEGGWREWGWRNEGAGKRVAEMQGKDGAEWTGKAGWVGGKKRWRDGSSDGRAGGGGGGGLQAMRWGGKGAEGYMAGIGGTAGGGIFGRGKNASGIGSVGMIEGRGRGGEGGGQVWGRVGGGVLRRTGGLGVGEQGMGRFVGLNKEGGGNYGMGMVGGVGEVEKGEGECETEGWCYCEAVRVEKCVREVEGGRRWCRVGECVEMKCRCAGEKMCEKKEGVVYEMVGGMGDTEGRCVGRVGTVVEEVEMGA